MRILKTFYGLLIPALLISVQPVWAEEKPFVVIETESHNVRISDDGTGIVKNIECGVCNFKIVNITPNTRATKQGSEVSILDVKGLRQAVVMVSFNPLTQEVQYIRW